MNDKIYTIVNAYLFAKSYVIKKGYAEEIDWQDEIKFDSTTETEVISEAAWVILSAGMNYNVVNKKFRELSPLFHNWECSSKIIEDKDDIIEKAKIIFNNGKKINAIIKFSEFLEKVGLQKFKANIKQIGPKYLLCLSFFGPATSCHLVKNLGLQYAKPDRHLTRISLKFGFESSESFCTFLSESIQEKKSVIDLVFWRYATLDHDYLSHLNRYLIKSNYLQTIN